MDQAEKVLTSAGYVLSEYKNHFKPNAERYKNGAREEGTIFRIPLPIEYNGDEVIENFVDGIHANLFDVDGVEELLPYELLEVPKTPYNVRAQKTFANKVL